ncbi:hypothetical protein MKW94_002453 [Papaver nudicaule]|uniref:Germin-like protein n=1 Tax=Papaver nudicaule TaxID=74823 RepID=A0AA42AVD5_PAPNU|nr:hypothetical protein [Papaver nudicaule]MCL7041595.1 hypothetical protein [Papaver nudicaule]
MESSICFLLVAFMALFSSFANATDPGPLQDFCVAAKSMNQSVFVNGFFCKDPKLVVADDFYLPRYNRPYVITNPVGSIVTLASVFELPGMNTLGISLARIDYAVGGINPPHTHPRATEIITVMEGCIRVGFVTSSPAKLFTKMLCKGDVFVFPRGLIHFQWNVGKKPAAALSSLSSQNPGTNRIADAIFGSKPFIDDAVLTKVFQVDKKVIDMLHAQFV